MTRVCASNAFNLTKGGTSGWRNEPRRREYGQTIRGLNVGDNMPEIRKVGILTSDMIEMIEAQGKVCDFIAMDSNKFVPWYVTKISQTP